jgi:hypothetical protein
MKTKKLPIFTKDPETGVSNEYPTSKLAFRQPCLWYISAVRNSGKSFLASKFLAQAHKDETFDRIYMITPSFKSNEAYFGKYIKKEDVYEPTRESISQVIASVEADRDEWEKFLAEQKAYKDFKGKFMTTGAQLNDEMLLMYYDMGFLDREPKWKYKTVEPPKSLLIMDDILSSGAISASSGLMKIATLNRHIAELQQNYKGRSACGLAVIILSQSYRMQNGQGIGRSIRENLSLFTMFKNKQPKQYEAIKEEIGSVVDMDRFDKAYQYATAEKYGSLTTDFKPKCDTLTFRKNLNEAIIFE